MIRFRDRFPDIKLIAAVPYPEFRSYSTGDWLEKYDRVLAGADHIQMIYSHTSEGIYQLRNQWMVDHSNKVIAVWNWKPSGTGNTGQICKRTPPGDQIYQGVKNAFTLYIAKARRPKKGPKKSLEVRRSPAGKGKCYET